MEQLLPLETVYIPAKGKSISHAISIIDSGLRASLDKSVGGEIAQNLDDLYSYMIRRLLEGNINNQEEALVEVQNLLKDLKGTWEAIDPNKNIQNTQSNHVPVAAKYDPLQPRPIHAFEA